ncbi:hypothetical protein OS033_08380 [Pseudomonas aeruginosa]|uniref:hypothetical protein n=1 Tax=Pseudomonas aeruginosa TaxID=287 RepID=UPI0023B24E15|nr:hypothetical protein [Pseudomonas aeruginosa]MDE9784710.1 hypothetical protein [Pseudomonas aeruginosa]
MKPVLLMIVNDPAFFMSHRLPVAVGAQQAGFQVHIATRPGDAVKKIVSQVFCIMNCHCPEAEKILFQSCIC